MVVSFKSTFCSPLICELLRCVLAEELYRPLDTWKRRFCCHGRRRITECSRDTKEQLLIDKMVEMNCKRRLKLLGVARIHCYIICNMVSHNLTDKSMEIFGAALNRTQHIHENMKPWNTELIVGDQKLENVKIKIFQGDNFLRLQFVLAMIPLALQLRETNKVDLLKRKEEKNNYVFLINGLKLLVKSKD